MTLARLAPLMLIETTTTASYVSKPVRAISATIVQ
jgi:hypothetical protein